MTRKITCSFTLTEEIIDYLDAHATPRGYSALVRQMLSNYIHATEIREYRHVKGGYNVSAFKCMSYDISHLPFGYWAVYDGFVSRVVSDAEFKAQYVGVEEV